MLQSIGREIFGKPSTKAWKRNGGLSWVASHSNSWTESPKRACHNLYVVLEALQNSCLKNAFVQRDLGIVCNIEVKSLPNR